MEVKDFIRFYRNKLGLSSAKFASLLNVSRSTVTRWENGEIKKLNDETIEALSNILNFDVESHLKLNLVKPLVGTVKAGYNLYAEENIQEYIEVSNRDAKQGDYFLEVTGDSMIGSQIYPGNLVYVKSVNDVDSGDIAIVLINGDEATIKKVIKKDSMLILEASNPNVENRYFTKEEVESLPVIIVGKVLYSKVNFN